MNHANEILLILREYDRKMILDSKLMALLYIIDEKRDNTSHYDNIIGDITVSIESDKILNFISKLDNEGYIEIIEKPTFGGHIKTQYRINNSGVKAIKKQNVDERTKKLVKTVYEEYGEYPISNLLKEIRKEYIDN